MSLTLFDLEPVPAPATLPVRGGRQRCLHGPGCQHPGHEDGRYNTTEPIWGRYPCHECGTDLLRFRRCGHWEYHADSWRHLRIHAYQRTPLAMDGRLWIGHPTREARP